MMDDTQSKNKTKQLASRTYCEKPDESNTNKETKWKQNIQQFDWCNSNTVGYVTNDQQITVHNYHLC